MQSLVFEEIDSPLSANPNPGDGLRIFPGRVAPGPGSLRRTVRVTATVAPAATGRTVFFRAFDLDDPSSDDAPVDPNGALGNDNRGMPQAGTLSAPSAPTDAGGRASVVFTVTMQPGDNFRVAASCLAEYLGGVRVEGIALEDAAGRALPTGEARQTEMLTVWRRVHIELDSMGTVTDNREAGKVRTRRPADNSLRVDTLLEPNRFAGGLMRIQRRDGTEIVYHVVSNEANRVVVVEPLVGGESNLPFVLFDDDDFDNDHLDFPNGDEGEDVPAPDISLIQDSDDPAMNVFAPAYVRPDYDVLLGDPAVPVVLNVSEDTGAARIATYRFDNVATEADPGFWTVYLLGGYQYVREEDRDGERALTFGVVDRLNGQGASVYAEALTEGGPRCANRETTAHEVGHLFLGSHDPRNGDDGGLMRQGCRKPLFFTPPTINKIRSVDHP